MNINKKKIKIYWKMTSKIDELLKIYTHLWKFNVKILKL